MAKVLYSAGISLDGFMTGPGGDMSWLTPYLGPNPQVEALIPQIGSLLVGRRTFDGDDPHKGGEGEGKAFGGGWEGPQYVVTHNPPDTTITDVTFVDDFGSALAQAKEAAGDKYVNVLGAGMGRQCLAAGQLDEIFVGIAPVLLGDGVRFFDLGGGNVKLERISQAELPLGTNLWFKIL
ncbi:dihydrofolate reductase [Kribbella qitaiheensis]|uniref:Dihydrofolate reductase n=1 Tax=Kribbella qitaiheensis TaxID=1544730 RepID=A0A7G6WXM8_9ACTN|nr:dihydrofolate reductase family protein [Kribbella qitaiheensis]QNE18743.1 dihydrofolate reductase [Kribbella qitaiheensis]